jgi:hypothetical protein
VQAIAVASSADQRLLRMDPSLTPTTGNVHTTPAPRTLRRLLPVRADSSASTSSSDDMLALPESGAGPAMMEGS